MLIEKEHDILNKFFVANEQLGPKTEFPYVEKIISIDSEGCKEFFTEGKNGHPAFSEKGKELSKNLWNSILDIAGEDKSADNITQITRTTFERIDNNTQGSSKAKNTLNHYFKLATGARIRNLERVELLETSDSPWKNVVSEIQNLHSDKSEEFVSNFAGAWIVSLRKKINTNIDSKQDLSPDTRNQLITACETDFADILSRTLQYSNEKKLKDIKKNGLKSLLTKSIEQYSDEDNLEDYINYTTRIKLTTPALSENKETETTVYESGLGLKGEIKAPKTGMQFWASEIKADKTILEEVKDKFFKGPWRNRVANATLFLTGVFSFGSLSGNSELITQQDLAAKFANDNQNTPANEVLTENELASIPSVDNVIEYAQTPSKRNGIKTEVPPTSTATMEPTSTPTTSPTPEPTKTYEKRLYEKLNIFGLDFTNEEKDINIGLKIGENDFSFSVKPVVKKDTRDKNKYDEMTAPGKGTAGVSVDSYGNIVLDIHSGYTPGIPQKNEWEGVRNWLEGGSLLDVAHINTRLNPEETEYRKQEMVGSRIPFTVDGTTKWFVVKEVVYISHDDLQNHHDDPIDVLRTINPTMENKNPVLDEYGDPISRFDKYADPDNPSLMIESCGWGPYGQKDWAQWSRWITIAVPEEASEEQSPLNRPRAAVEILHDAINRADREGKEHGEELANSIRNTLIENGIEITQNMGEKLEIKVKDETNIVEPDGNLRDLQCIAGTELSSALPDTEDWVDIGGLRIHDPENADSMGDGKRGIKSASELFYNLENGKKLSELDTVGWKSSGGGIVRVRVDKLGMTRAGDILVTDKSYGQQDGHVVRILDVWQDEEGKSHALIFDVNFANDGKARIVEITDENMDEVLAGVPEGQKAKIIAVRTGVSQEKIVAQSTNN